MTSTVTKKPSSIQYSSSTIKRAERALRCSGFLLNLFITMMSQSVSLNEISSDKAPQKGYVNREIAEAKAENQLMWLIKVGVLRREVDGQGITDSFRLTPLGKEIVSKTEENNKHFPQASIFDHIINTLNRWFSGQL